MTLNILLSARPALWDPYSTALPRACAAAGLDVTLHRAGEIAPGEVDYVVFAPNGPVEDFAPFTRAKAALSLWAGVEQIVGNETLRMPLARMVDSSLTEGMVEWVTGMVLRHHLGIDRHIVNPEQKWQFVIPPLARDRVVTVLGTGALGAACAKALVGLNFQVRGWSRSMKQIEGVESFAGDEGFWQALEGAGIVVLLLPDTPATENVMSTRAFAAMAEGSFVINPGRGPLIDEAALLAALESGQVAHATLDVFRQEPLPEGHAFWAHPQITVTAHTASETRVGSASEAVAENIRRAEAGEPLVGLVDRAAGY
ncbi:glyoxylate/hydroxypyruvate reductase A [Oceanicola sp. 502str15]|uniref:2-hydroxyacid dehydrogenase n=1 Tax=Oceanicola sp. 502str15 TaxID=2696061 RepID=UPI00209531B8|nr:glyoxylate/hydroxypyruvate reductase A [Oceanicola sp. 502str15]MCO6383218.1 glyoxylate/hydroxypyruvate reductase A [Oceanicola sp. 502str15]